MTLSRIAALALFICFLVLPAYSQTDLSHTKDGSRIRSPANSTSTVSVSVPYPTSHSIRGLGWQYLGQRKFTFLPYRSAYQLFGPTVLCNQTLAAYNRDFDEGNTFSIGRTCPAHCLCLFENLDELSKSQMGTSTLILGLIPLLLATLSPSISETALLSIENPILAALIALATVTVFPSRQFYYHDDNVQEILQKPGAIPKQVITFLRSGSRRRLAVRLVEYGIVLLCIWNLCDTSWTTGRSTILNFNCTASFPILLWTFAPVVIHLTSVVGFRISLWKVRRSHAKRQRRDSSRRSELGVRQEQDSDLDFLEPSFAIQGWHHLVGILAYCHVLTGIVVFSSTIFAFPFDAMQIFARYMVSVLFTRFVLMYEIGWMKIAQQRRKADADVELRECGLDSAAVRTRRDQPSLRRLSMEPSSFFGTHQKRAKTS